METWAWGLLLKPILGLAFLAFVFGLAWIVKTILKAVMPEGRVKEYLFRGDSGVRRQDTRPSERVLDDATVSGGERREDAPRLGGVGKDLR
jgi:hypothetical protein